MESYRSNAKSGLAASDEEAATCVVDDAMGRELAAKCLDWYEHRKSKTRRTAPPIPFGGSRDRSLLILRAAARSVGLAIMV